MISTLIGTILKKLKLAGPDPLTSMDEAIGYAERQAAFVSQFTLYGYIKTRVGTQYPKLFRDEPFLDSMKIARWHIFGASVCDVAVFIAAQLVRAGHAPATGEAAASRIIESILSKVEQDDISPKEFRAMIQRGNARAATANWADLMEGPAVFQSSADALMRWAPIADELKNQDDEIVRNSIHMKWIGIRREIKEIIVPDQIVATL